MHIFAVLDKWRQDGVATWAQSDYGWILDSGAPIVLSDWQTELIRLLSGDVSTVLVSTVKKAGKTTLNSVLTCYRWLTIPSVHFTVANDQSQGEELQFNLISAMVERNRLLKRHVKANKNELTFIPTGSRIVNLPMDASGAAGANFATVSFSELWGYRYEEGRRLYEELTPIPLRDCLRIVDSYAGFENESELLEMVWQRGLSGERVSDDWPMYRTGQQISYIHTGEDAQRRCWRGFEAEREAYYKEQRETLRAGTYNRLHLNEWAASEDVFITSEQWDNLIDSSHRVPEPSKAIRLFAACDIGVKRDHSAVVSVYRHDNELFLGPYRVWKPIGGKEVNLQAVEDYIAQLWQAYSAASIAGDPSQFLHIKQRLAARGVAVTEFVQSASRLTEAGNTLFDVIRQGRLRVYANSDELKGYVLNARAKETDRGIRLVKDTASKKIDAAIALAMAVTEAEQNNAGPEPAGVTTENIDLGIYKPERRGLFSKRRRHREIY